MASGSGWASVDVLIRELGAVRAASYGTPADAADGVKAAIAKAISEATDAVCLCLNAPQDAGGITRAHDAIEVAADVLAALDTQLERSLRIRARSSELRGRAKELVEQARAVWRE